MKYKHINTEEEITYEQLVKRFKGTGIGIANDGTSLIADVWRMISPIDPPSFDPLIQGVRELPAVQYVQTWEVYELSDVQKEEKRTFDLNRRTMEWKEKRKEKVENLIVEYNGYHFEGDEKSQDRIARTIVGLPDEETIMLWTDLKDEDVPLVREDFRNILRIAGIMQRSIWSEGRPS